MSLQATFRSPRTDEYARPGGPWDLPVDRILAGKGSRALDATSAFDAAALSSLVARRAGGLAAARVGPGDVVLWQRANDVDGLALVRACWRLGAVAAPLHHRAGPADVERARALLQPALDLVGVEVLPEAEPPTRQAIAPDEIAVVAFTAGSSGEPKAVLHTRRALAYKATVMVATHALNAEDVVLMPAPLGHISGLLNAVLVAGAAGMTSVLMPRWDPTRALELVEEHRVSFMVGPPTFFVALMEAEAFRPERVASLRIISSGGAGVTPAFVERARRELGARVKRTYGSTEAPSLTTPHADDPIDHDQSSDGRPVGAAELRVDPERGELEAQGPELFVGYANAADNDGAFTADGWFRTGDLASIDEAGRVTITGRLKDVIIRGGENISTGRVEAMLEAHPAVTGAVVVGYPDELMGERVCAFVVLTDGATFDLATCREFFAAEGVARFMTPERLVVLDAFPLLPSGKPDRVKLRATAGRPV